MAYPRNQAAPERISIGAVVKIADGEVQESDVLIRVLAQGEDPAVGEGTVGYQDGIVHYTPTQAETDHTSVIFIAHKADCIPASVTVVTTTHVPQSGDSYPVVTNATYGLDKLARTGADATQTLSTIAAAIAALPEAAAVAVFNDQTYDSDGVEIDAGTIDSGTTADTLTIGTPLVFESEGSGIDVNFEFDLGPDARVSELVVAGYYTGTGGPATSKYMDVYLWDYSLETPVWVLQTDGSNRIPHGSSNTIRQYVIAPQFQDPTTGVVKVRYVSSRTTSGDTFVLDQHYIEGVNVGATLDEIANAVATYRISDEAARDGTHSRLAWYLYRTVAAVFGIDDVTGNEVTCSGDRFDSDADYVGHTLQFHLGGTNDYRFARVTAQTGAVLTVDDIQDVTDAWHGYIMPERPITAAQAAVVESIAGSTQAAKNLATRETGVVIE